MDLNKPISIKWIIAGIAAIIFCALVAQLVLVIRDTQKVLKDTKIGLEETKIYQEKLHVLTCELVRAESGNRTDCLRDAFGKPIFK